MRFPWNLTLALLLSISWLGMSCDDGGSDDNKADVVTAADNAAGAEETTEPGEDTVAAEDTGSTANDGSGEGACWEPPPYPQDLYAKEGSSVKATAVVGDDEYIVNFDCAGDEISYRMKNEDTSYAVVCHEEDWVLTFSCPTETGSWSHEGVMGPYEKWGVGFTGNSPDFHAWALTDSGAEQGSLTVDAYDDCSRDVSGEFQASYLASEPLNKQAATISGTFDLKM